MEPDARGTYTFKARSFTRQSGWSYRVRVNLRTNEMDCSCGDYRYRRGPDHGLCKHLRRALVTARLAERVYARRADR